MSSESLVMSIEDAFAGLKRPSLEEMAAPDASVEDSFIEGVGTKTWQELRPLRQYVGSGGEIAVLSAKAYQYYLPAYLVALADRSTETFYLNGVLESLCYESDLPVGDSLILDLLGPRDVSAEALRELGPKTSNTEDYSKVVVAGSMASIAVKLAHITEMTGHDWHDRSYARARWEERMALLTYSQKRCISRTLVNILERGADRLRAPRIQTTLDAYWGVFLEIPGRL